MKKTIIHIFAFIITIVSLSGCFGHSSRESKEKYDLYTVNVRSTLNMRAEPNPRARLLTRLGNGDTIKVLSYSPDWSYIKTDRYYGYVSSKYINPVTAPIDNEPQESIPSTTTSTASLSNDTIPASDYPKAGILDICDNAGILSIADVDAIKSKLEKNKLNITVVTIDSVAPLKIFSIADDINDEITKQINNNDSRGWFKRKWDNIVDAFYNEPFKDIQLRTPEHYTFVYISSLKLLTSAGSGPTIKLMRQRNMENYYSAQLLARTSATDGIIRMIDEFNDAKQQYSKWQWWKRGQASTASIFDYVADEILVQNILPNDSFLHKYVIGWIFAIPFKLAYLTVDLCESVTHALILLGLIYISISFFSYCYRINARGTNSNAVLKHRIHILLRFIIFVFWLVIISMIIYMIPDMRNIANMEVNGYSATCIYTFTEHYQFEPISRSWLLITMLITGLILKVSIEPDLILLTTLSPEMQRKHFKQYGNSIIIDYALKMGPAGGNLTDFKYDTADKPYSILAANYFISTAAKFLFSFTWLPIALNTNILFFVTIYIWIEAVSNTIKLIFGFIDYKRAGVYT